MDARLATKLEYLGMIDGLLAFFSAFNPIVFGFIVSVGVIIAVRRPAPAPLARTSTTRQRDAASPTWRRP